MTWYFMFTRLIICWWDISSLKVKEIYTQCYFFGSTTVTDNYNQNEKNATIFMILEILISRIYFEKYFGLLTYAEK